MLQLHGLLAAALTRLDPALRVAPPVKGQFREGDVRHSLADIGKAASLLRYSPSHDVRAGLEDAASWYVAQDRRNG